MDTARRHCIIIADHPAARSIRQTLHWSAPALFAGCSRMPLGRSWPLPPGTRASGTSTPCQAQGAAVGPTRTTRGPTRHSIASSSNDTVQTGWTNAGRRPPEYGTSVARRNDPDARSRLIQQLNAEQASLLSVSGHLPCLPHPAVWDGHAATTARQTWKTTSSRGCDTLEPVIGYSAVLSSSPVKSTTVHRENESADSLG